MQSEQPSRTAMRVAMRRAAHQLFDSPPVHVDPIAVPIIGASAAAELTAARESGSTARALRAFMAVRSRLAEDELARSVQRGVRQYVILGAGLDTFAYRSPFAASGLHTFEVDFPATQQWKRRKLAEAEISVPASLTFVPVDFENQSLAAELARSGFDPREPAFFTWLGVTMYLSRAAIDTTFDYIASTGVGGGAVFDYAVPRSTLSWLERIAFDALTRRVAGAGEPFLTFFDPMELRASLASRGFQSIEDLGRDELNARYFESRADDLRVRGNLGRIVSAER